MKWKALSGLYLTTLLKFSLLQYIETRLLVGGDEWKIVLPESNTFQSSMRSVTFERKIIALQTPVSEALRGKQAPHLSTGRLQTESKYHML
jgi:hypothetical protein